LRRQVDAIEANEALDPVVEQLGSIATRVGAGDRGEVLRGQWLGHAAHPLLTDFPLGCWASASLLDLLGGKRSRTGARRLIALGLAFVPVTAATGMADWAETEDPPVRRVGAVHAVGNTAVAALYFLSWRARHRGHHLRGVGLALAGGAGAWATGYLGGHLSFARGVGVGERGLHDELPSGAHAIPHDPDLVGFSEAARLLEVEPAQIEAMVAGDLLVPADGSGTAALFRRSDLMAARLTGA
jgi:uncharacterized membrane protein